MKIQPKQRVAVQQKHDNADDQDAHADVKLEAEGMAHAVVVAFAVKLGAVDARAGQRAEDRQVKHKQKLVDDSDARHRLRADAPDHDIVQQADEVGDAVLNNDRHRHRQHFFIKCFITDKLAHLRILLLSVKSEYVNNTANDPQSPQQFNRLVSTRCRADPEFCLYPRK